MAFGPLLLPVEHPTEFAGTGATEHVSDAVHPLGPTASVLGPLPFRKLYLEATSLVLPVALGDK